MIWLVTEGWWALERRYRSELQWFREIVGWWNLS